MATTRSEILRWGVVPAASLAGFVAAFVIGASARNLVEHWCPWGILDPNDSPWCPVPVWVDATLYGVSASLAAALVVLFGTVMAPTRARWVPWLIYGLGAAAAVTMATALMLDRRIDADAAAGAFAAKEAARRIATSIVPVACSLLAGAIAAHACARRRR